MVKFYFELDLDQIWKLVDDLIAARGIWLLHLTSEESNQKGKV